MELAASLIRGVLGELRELLLRRAGATLASAAADVERISGAEVEGIYDEVLRFIERGLRPAGAGGGATESVVILPVANLGAVLNRASHGMTVWATTASTRGMLNRWRRERLGLPPVRDELVVHGRPVLRLYGYSPAVVPTPPYWDASSVATGYWFLDRQAEWQPPESLMAFLERGPQPVYVGFGGMPAEDAAATTRVVLDALARSGQPFWGRRVATLEVGTSPIPQRGLTAERLAAATRTVTTDGAMRERAAQLAERIRGEDGVARAVALVERAAGLLAHGVSSTDQARLVSP